MATKIKNVPAVWSAAPTPLNKSMNVDLADLKKMINHHVGLGVEGIFIGGTCGEGPFLTRDQFDLLTEKTVEFNKGRMMVSVQVTDNSYSKVLDNIKRAKNNGADVAIVAEPWFGGIMKMDVLEKYYFEVVEKAVMPVGIYSRGISISPATYKKLLLHPNVCMFKDSSCNDEIMNAALSVMKERKDIAVLTGYELGMDKYMRAGYTGAVAGGGVLIGGLVAKMVEAARNGQMEQVDKIQKHCDRILYPSYGGRKIKSWLTGLKYTLVKMGIFKSTAGYLTYPVPESIKKSIDKMLKKEKSELFPYKG
jgi:4-hydroxy-tetrahydrodipicolinate synthase